MRLAAAWNHLLAVLCLGLALGLAGCGPRGPTPCAKAGGSCVGVGDCSAGQGHLGKEDCRAVHDVVCCFPESACGGAETFECCGPNSGGRPWCVDGTLQCDAGESKVPLGQCK